MTASGPDTQIIVFTLLQAEEYAIIHVIQIPYDCIVRFENRW